MIRQLHDTDEFEIDQMNERIHLTNRLGDGTNHVFVFDPALSARLSAEFARLQSGGTDPKDLQK